VIERARTSRSYDVVVVGLGAMGSAVVYQLAKAGARVLGIERFAPPHAHGSSHGDSRITRLAVGEGAQYVPLAVRSHELWREIEALTGEELLTVTGGVVISVPGGRGQHGAGDFLATTIAAAQAHGITHEELDSTALADRFPPFELRGDERGMFEPSAGFVRPERAVAAQLRLAREHGADLRTGERVITAGQRRVVTEAGTYSGETIVLAAGPWLPELRPELASAFAVSRQVMHWFALAPGTYEAHRDLPVFIWITGDGPEQFFYGFPAIDGPDGGLKVASEQFQATTTPAACRREVTPEESRALHARFLAGRLPGLQARTVKATTCLYTSTADSSFAIGAHPGDADLLVVSACSGHGFKHSPAIGEAVAQRALTGESTIDLRPFGVGRHL
jgi:sarcosine oxidase